MGRDSDWKRALAGQIANLAGASALRRRWSRAGLLGAIPRSAVPEPIREAIAAGIAAGNAKRRPSQEVRMVARAIRDRARATDGRHAAIPELLQFVRDYPEIEEFQKLIARFLQETHDVRALEAWLGISLGFPRSMDAFHNLAVLTHRQEGPRATLSVLKTRFPRIPARLDELLVYAEACDLAGATSDRRAAFARVARLFEKRSGPWLTATSWIEEESGFNRSVVMLLKRLAAGVGLGAPIVQESRHLRSVIGDWDAADLRKLDKGAIASVRVLGALFDRVIEARQLDTTRRTTKAGPAFLLTGSLGAGGAERQLVNTAIGLNEMSLQQRTLRDGLVLDSVNVVARTLRDRKDGSFFLSDLQRANVPVRSYREMPDFAGNIATSSVRPALSALGLLPWSTAEAVIKLTDWLRSKNPEVVHIWQDGVVYAAGLAALLAGVPRIVLGGRSTPPPDRREHYPIEYDVIYKSLLRAPGVKLSVNSHYAASRYSAWLDIDPASIAVVPNGVTRLAGMPDAESEALFHSFEARTGRATLTVGAVMRLDEVKRPLLWIDSAASILARIPDARFIIVGDGPLRMKAEIRAESLGIAGRCLFTGRSSCIGYWLSKMDTLLLLSEHEGLPNALIEAQLAGVPVVTSPAGGAPEALLPGTTGLVTSANPTPNEVANMIVWLASQGDCLRRMGVAAEQWGQETFPVSRMLSNTLAVYSDAGRGRNLAAAEAPVRAALAEPVLQYTRR